MERGRCSRVRCGGGALCCLHSRGDPQATSTKFKRRLLSLQLRRLRFVAVSDRAYS